MKQRPTPEVCPVCGEDVPPKAKACPSCGACHESGWGEDGDPDAGAAQISEHGYEDEEKFDYERWRAREEGRERVPGIRPMWKWAALAVLAAMFLGFWKAIYQFLKTPWF